MSSKTATWCPRRRSANSSSRRPPSRLEVYREIQNRGLRMPRELPIAAPYKRRSALISRAWTRACTTGAGIMSKRQARPIPSDAVPGHPTGRVLSFLVDAEAIAALAERQASADAAALAPGPGAGRRRRGGVLPFVGALPRTDDEAVAFLKAQCSTDVRRRR